ncbi:hypothetical protein ACPCIR_05910 [Mycobacterium sp. NPDC051198]
MSELVRQGEVLLVPTSGVLFGDRRTVRSHIVGHSESGHHHVLESDHEFDVIITGDELLIELRDPGWLIHQAQSDQHRTLGVAPGTYRVLRKRRYHPLQDSHDYLAD